MTEEKSAEGRIHEQKNFSDSTSSYYDDTGDEVKKNEKGNWVKKESAASTKSTTSSKVTT